MPEPVGSTPALPGIPVTGPATAPHGAGPPLTRLAWWLLLGTCLLYGGFAHCVVAVEVAALSGLEWTQSSRTLSPLFIVHALAGGLALIVGPLQVNPRLRLRHPARHRAAGRIYVIGACVCGLSALPVALTFSDGLPARVAFALLTALWVASTLAGVSAIMRGDTLRHREWMLRSFALCLFFVTFSVWDPALGAGLPDDLAFPLAVTLGWVPNLLVVELWIRHTRFRSGVAHRLSSDQSA